MCIKQNHKVKELLEKPFWISESMISVLCKKRLETLSILKIF